MGEFNVAMAISTATGTLHYPPRGPWHREDVALPRHGYDTGYGVVSGAPIHSMAIPASAALRKSRPVDSSGGPSFAGYWRRTGYEGRCSDSYQVASPSSTLAHGSDGVSVGGFRQGKHTNMSVQTDPFVGTAMPSGTLYYPRIGFRARPDNPERYCPRDHADAEYFSVIGGRPLMVRDEMLDYMY